MKFCPVCKSNVFDDMDTCFNCLHKFSEADGDGRSVDVVRDEYSARCNSTTASAETFVECQRESGLSDFLSHYYEFLGQYIASRKFDLQHTAV